MTFKEFAHGFAILTWVEIFSELIFAGYLALIIGPHHTFPWSVSQSCERVTSRTLAPRNAPLQPGTGNKDSAAIKSRLSIES
jgi:hypothetical protein